MPNRLQNALVPILVSFLAFTLSGCGSSSSGSAPTATTASSVSISTGTASASVISGQSTTFSATVANATNTGVAWSIQEGASGGTITAAGVYTAPTTPGTYHVIAAATQDPSKTATITVTVLAAPNPVFTSTAPTAAVQGTAYAYNLTATDPANTAIAFSLTSSPAGASIAGNTLTWTPTAAQSRTSNSFAITATTAAGGRATQTFTVTPAGTVLGTKINTTISDAGEGSMPVDLSAAPIIAYIPDGTGNFTTLTGAGDSSGNFHVDGVPAGSYLLKVGSDYLWTSKTVTDFGKYVGGRPDITTATSSSTSLQLSLTNASPWDPADYVEWYSTNTNGIYVLTFNPGTGSTTYSGSTSWRGRPLVDASKGDQVYISQLHSMASSVAPYTLNTLTRLSGPLSLTFTDGATNTVTDSFNDVGTGSSVRLNVQGSAFAAIGAAANPKAYIDSNNISLTGQPNATKYGWLGGVEYVTYIGDQGNITTDIDFGDVAFGNPFPTWNQVVDYSIGVWMDYKVPGSSSMTTTAFDILSTTTATLPTASAPLKPLIGQVGSPLINGADFFSDQTGIGLTPTLTWIPPSLGTPTGYRVVVSMLQPTQAFATTMGVLYTTDTSLTLPPGLLLSGRYYCIRITALYREGIDMTVSPNRIPVPNAAAPVISGMVTP